MADQQNQQLDQLKQKYQSVLSFIQKSNVRLSHVHIQGGKLFIQGEAPSQEIKNKVWDQIKLVDPNYSDLTADITVSANAPSAQTAQSTGQSAAGVMQTYTVQPGDTLSKISKELYGDAQQYMKIFEANKDQLKDPDHIKSGQVLKIPA